MPTLEQLAARSEKRVEGYKKRTYKNVTKRLKVFNQKTRKSLRKRK